MNDHRFRDQGRTTPWETSVKAQAKARGRAPRETPATASTSELLLTMATEASHGDASGHGLLEQLHRGKPLGSVIQAWAPSPAHAASEGPSLSLRRKSTKVVADFCPFPGRTREAPKAASRAPLFPTQPRLGVFACSFAFLPFMSLYSLPVAAPCGRARVYVY